MLIGGLPAALRMLLCGKWYLCVFWSIFERKRMTNFEGCERTLQAIVFFLQKFVSLDDCFCSPLVISYYDFLVPFYLFIQVFSLLYTSCVLGVPYTYNDILITSKKEKKKKKKKKKDWGFSFGHWIWKHH
jgi:hypothetical protein